VCGALWTWVVFLLLSFIGFVVYLAMVIIIAGIIITIIIIIIIIIKQ